MSGRRDVLAKVDALIASRSVMKRALSEIAFWGEDEKAATVARRALDESRVVLEAGLRSSAPRSGASKPPGAVLRGD